jgi:hypothetical protein
MYTTLYKWRIARSQTESSGGDGDIVRLNIGQGARPQSVRIMETNDPQATSRREEAFWNVCVHVGYSVPSRLPCAKVTEAASAWGTSSKEILT